MSLDLRCSRFAWKQRFLYTGKISYPYQNLNRSTYTFIIKHGKEFNKVTRPLTAYPWVPDTNNLRYSFVAHILIEQLLCAGHYSSSCHGVFKIGGTQIHTHTYNVPQGWVLWDNKEGAKEVYFKWSGLAKASLRRWNFSRREKKANEQSEYQRMEYPGIRSWGKNELYDQG